jgi:hypothetical protein
MPLPLLLSLPDVLIVVPGIPLTWNNRIESIFSKGFDAC